MTKAVALYAIKYSIFNELPWELKGIIIEDLPNNHVEYLLDHFPDLNWDYDKLSELKISIPHLKEQVVNHLLVQKHHIQLMLTIRQSTLIKTTLH